MSFKKIDKEFCLTDNSVNCYKYRLLTEGLLLERFNPAIGYLMHDRAGKAPAVKWEDFRRDGDKLFAKPVVNTVDYPGLAEKIENGFYAAASVGKIVALKVDDSPEMKLDGQTDVTVTEWFPREISIVDLPGNYNATALAVLYDENDSILKDLSDNKKESNTLMNKPLVPAYMLAGLSLPETATEAEAQKKFNDLVAKAEKSEKLEKELTDLKASQTDKELADLAENGVTAGKITNELATKLKSDYKGNPSGLKSLLDSLPAQTRVTADLVADMPEKYRGKTYTDLFISNELEAVKRDYPELFQKLKNEQKK